VSAGGTCTWKVNTLATEIQAGSYALMDHSYAYPDLPFRPSVFVLGRVISVSESFAVADAGLKALAMDHGKSGVEGASVWFYSDEHVTFAPDAPLEPGDMVRVLPMHVDPTVAKHERLHLFEGDEVVDVWEIDLRGW
jgi:D-serine deaminase-like pyridoxal phosphate-dependent protein